MIKQARLITTDSYFNIFNILGHELKKMPNGIENKALIFCEEKISLLAESTLCRAKKGSLSTDVYSFGNYLRKKTIMDKVLTKEGSSMAIKRILKTLPLKCFNRSRNTISSSVYNLIVQLKSAKVMPSDILKAKDSTEGILKNKLEDIYTVYSAYENFIKENGYEDQSSVLSYLPQVVFSDEKMPETDVYLVGYTSWTRQALSAVEALLERAKSITAILPAGDNGFSFVNETYSGFIKVCQNKNIDVVIEKNKSPYVKEGEIIESNLFNPSSFGTEKFKTEKISLISAFNDNEQIEKVAEIIKSQVIHEKKRYSDFTVCISEPEKEQARIKKIFSTLDIPYFLDIKKKGENTALCSLINAYVEVFRKNYEINAVSAFFKNPFFGLNKDSADEFENYLIRYNINYSKIKEEFTLKSKDEDLVKLNEIRERILDITSEFNVRKMLSELKVEEKQKDFTEKLYKSGHIEESAVNEQIYGAITNILNEMDLLLGKDISVNEFRETFLSGIKALELSIIPQYQDAVFIGDFKECALYQNKTVFALNLTADVPNVKEDVAILNDGDLSVLENIKVLVDPKIRIINHRYRENVAMALSCFTEKLYLCCPTCTSSGKNNVKSEILSYFDAMFTLYEYSGSFRYLTYKQGIKSFSKDCTMFIDKRKTDIKDACNFYYAVKPNDKTERVLSIANSQIDKEITVNRPLISGVISPTVLENYSTCPYKTFIENYLRVKDREHGEVDALSIGNLIHEVFEKFLKNINNLSENQIDGEVGKIIEEILQRDEYKRYVKDDKQSTVIERAEKECKNYCHKIFGSLKSSFFKPKYVEKRFGDGKENSLPPIKLLNGKVNLKGKIDRVDEYENYVRIIDYKTGSVKTEKKNLFTGNKLQLNLYSQVFSDKKIAGSYYMPVSDAFESLKDKESAPLLVGDTVDDMSLLKAMDTEFNENDKSKIISAKIKGEKIEQCVSENSLDAFNKYAYYISEKIAENLLEGYIPASPFKEACAYCKYLSVCGNRRTEGRDVLKVNSETIEQAVSEKEDK